MDSNHRLRDFLTTTTFVAFSVCGLDYTFTIPFGLGVPRLVSTPSSCDAWLGIAILQVSPNLRNYTHKISQMRLNFHKSLASSAGLHGLVYETIITQRIIIVNAHCGNLTHLRRFMRTLHSNRLLNEHKVRILGIEPRPTRYKQAALPLSYTRIKLP